MIFRPAPMEIMPRILKIVLIFAAAALASCASKEVNYAVSPPKRVFHAPYDHVWRAAQIAITKYPLKVNNMDAGLLVTDTLKGDEIWTPPYVKDKPSAGTRCHLELRFLKGEVDDKPAVEVVTMKSCQLLRSYFSDPEDLKSDGLEEKVVLYRIGRELAIEQTLEKVQKTKNKQQMEQNN